VIEREGYEFLPLPGLLTSDPLGAVRGAIQRTREERSGALPPDAEREAWKYRLVGQLSRLDRFTIGFDPLVPAADWTGGDLLGALAKASDPPIGPWTWTRTSRRCSGGTARPSTSSGATPTQIVAP